MMNMPPSSKKNSKSSSSTASATSINDNNNRNMNKLKLSGHQAIGGGGGGTSKNKSGGGVGRLFKGSSSKKTTTTKDECTNSTVLPDSTAPQVVVVEGDRRRRHGCSSSTDNNDLGMSSIGSGRSSTGTRSAGAAVIASYKQKDNKKTLANEAKIAKYISEERWDDIWQLIIKHGDTSLHNKGTASVHVRYDGDDYSNGNILHMICHRALTTSGGNKKSVVKRRGSLSTQDNEAKCLKVIKGLMNLFPLLDIQVNANKQTPLHVAVSLGGGGGDSGLESFQRAIVSTLLKYGSSSPTLMQDCYGRTPLHTYLITHSSGLWNMETGQRNPSLREEQSLVDVQVLRWLSEAGPKSITMEDANGQRPLNMIQELATLGDALEGNKVTGSIYRAMERTSKLGQVVNGPLNQPAASSSGSSRRGSMSLGGGAGRTSCRSLELPSQGYTSIERLSPTSSLLQQVSSSIQGHNYDSSDQNNAGFSSTVSDGALVNVYRARKNAKVGFVDKIIHGGAAADVADQSSRRRSMERASRGKGDLAFAAAEASLQLQQQQGGGGGE